MTRKDFELIAATVKAIGCLEYPQRCIVAHEFAQALKATNKQFNRDKFIRACGVTP